MHNCTLFSPSHKGTKVGDELDGKYEEEGPTVFGCIFLVLLWTGIIIALVNVVIELHIDTHNDNGTWYEYIQ